MLGEGDGDGVCEKECVRTGRRSARRQGDGVCEKECARTGRRSVKGQGE